MIENFDTSGLLSSSNILFKFYLGIISLSFYGLYGSRYVLLTIGVNMF